MKASGKAILIFIDGLGMGEKDPAVNPIYRGASPVLADWLDTVAVPIDAGLGIPGHPQSATGQATLLTGENAAAFMGRHVEGRPGPQLRTFVEAHNLFDQLQALGLPSTFANAYPHDDMEDVRTRRWPSVTTVSVLQAFGQVRLKDEMLADRAVYQDLTRISLRERGYDGPLTTPRDAATHLAAIAEAHAFTLFEYFQTDLQAHRGTEEDVLQVLRELDEFVGAVAEIWPGEDRLLVLTSDHGNIEEARTRSHTENPVPLIAFGWRAEMLKDRMKGLEDFVPALLQILQET